MSRQSEVCFDSGMGDKKAGERFIGTYSSQRLLVNQEHEINDDFKMAKVLN